MSLFKIALSNMKKRKAGMITLFLMIIVASLIFMIGLNLIFGLNNYYEKKVDELNSSHFAAYIKDDKWNNEVYDLAFTHKTAYDIETAEYEDCFMSSKNLDIDIKDKVVTGFIGFHSINFNRKITPLKIIDKLNVMPVDAVVAPLFIKLNGLKAGDTLKIGSLNFTIYGFFEDAEFGSSMITMHRVYISDETLAEMSDNQGFFSSKFLTVRFNDVNSIKVFSKDFSNICYGTSGEVIYIPWELSKSSATGFISIISVFIVLFALIIFIVALIIARFNINSNIEDDIINLGALKSVGYTTRQITLSLIIQYLFIALVACVFGAALTVLALPMVGNIVSSSSGLLWVEGFNILPILISVVFMLMITVLTAYLTGRKTKKITPVNALRSGLGTHNFKKNKVAMSKNKLPLQLNLGLKALFNNIKNNITIFLVILLFIFASLIGLTFQYNFSADREALNAMIGVDPYSVIYFKEDNFESEINEVLADERVKSFYYYDNMNLMYDGTALQLYISSNYNLKKYDTCYEGSYPKYKGDIAIGGIFAKSINKGLGDTIKINLRGKEAEFTIVGLTQSLADTGLDAYITVDGMKEIDGNYIIKNIAVILKNNNDKEKFIEDYNFKFLGKADVIDAESVVDEAGKSLAGTINMVFLLIIITAVLIISLVLFLLISTLIRKNKKNFGIQKALGYSNWQLMRQVIYTFMPVIILAAIFGFIFSLFAVNPVLSLVLSSFGLVSASFKINILYSVLIALSIMVLSFIISVFVSLRIKKISAIKLIVE